jgi:hypothetical protein
MQDPIGDILQNAIARSDSGFEACDKLALVKANTQRRRSLNPVRYCYALIEPAYGLPIG